MMHFWWRCILCDAFCWWQISYMMYSADGGVRCWGFQGIRTASNQPIFYFSLGLGTFLPRTIHLNFKVGNVFERPQFQTISIITTVVFHSIFSITIALYDHHRALESFTPCVQCASLTSRRIFQMQASDTHHQLQMHLRSCILSLYSCHSFQHLLSRSASTGASEKQKDILKFSLKIETASWSCIGLSYIGWRRKILRIIELEEVSGILNWFNYD